MENSLTEVLNEVINQSSNQGQIMPSWIANAAYQQIDPHAVSPWRVKLAALQALKQIARQLLRGKFEPQNDTDADQHELWPGLQTRYPLARQTSDGEPIYVKPELLTAQDVIWNIHRLRSESATKLKHARALEQWAIERGLDLANDTRIAA